MCNSYIEADYPIPPELIADYPIPPELENAMEQADEMVGGSGNDTIISMMEINSDYKKDKQADEKENTEADNG